MDLSIRMRVIYNVKDRYAIRLKFRGNFLNQVSARIKSHYLLYNKKSLLLYCSTFLAFIFVATI